VSVGVEGGAEWTDDVSSMPLVLWAACLLPRDLVARSEALVAGGFSAMTASPEDFIMLETERGWTLEQTATELRAREAPITVIDGYLGWYPGWNPEAFEGPHAAALNATSDAILRYADVLGADSITLLGPFDGGAPAPAAEVSEALGKFADLAGQHGLRIHVEVVPTSRVPDLQIGWEIVRQVDRDNVGLILDTFHLARSGCTTSLLDQVPLGKIFHLQVCDGPITPLMDNYLEEVVTHRVFAGDGELPVAELVQSIARRGPLPPIGPEVFSEEVWAMPPDVAGRLCANRTREFLAGVKSSIAAADTAATDGD
jgi:sugar phosphate isomerase/epimerase